MAAKRSVARALLISGTRQDKRLATTLMAAPVRVDVAAQTPESTASTRYGTTRAHTRDPTVVFNHAAVTSDRC